MKLKTKKLIIWDFDDTISHTCPVFVNSMNELLISKGKPRLRDEDVCQYRGAAMDEIMNRFMPDESFGQAMSEFAVLNDHFERLMTLQDGVVSFLKKTKKNNITNILVSNRGKQSLVEHLDRFNIKEYFDFIQGKEENIPAKPRIDVFNYIKENFKVVNNFSVDEMLYIGDSVSDINFAKNIGIKDVVLIRNRYSPNGFYENSGHKVVNSFKEINI